MCAPPKLDRHGPGDAAGFSTTALGTTVSGIRMTLDPSGNLGIGTQLPSAAVEVAREGATADFLATSYGGAGGGDSGGFFARTARGTAAAPTAVQLDDELGYFAMTGYGATGFGEGNAAMGAFAGENWPTRRKAPASISRPRRSGKAGSRLATW